MYCLYRIYLKNIAIFHFGDHAKKREIPPNISIIGLFETRSYMKWHFNFPYLFQKNFDGIRFSEEEKQLKIIFAGKYSFSEIEIGIWVVHSETGEPSGHCTIMERDTAENSI